MEIPYMVYKHVTDDMSREFQYGYVEKLVHKVQTEHG